MYKPWLICRICNMSSSFIDWMIPIKELVNDLIYGKITQLNICILAIMRKKKLVVLSGAGISAESGLQTFRDADGLWEGYRIEDVATPRAWKRNPRLVLDFYNMRRRAALAAVPNTAHIGFATLEEQYDVQIITQNIDDLHERAGSTNVLHLHGELLKMCSAITREEITPIRSDINLGDITPSGHQYRPFIVWFEEPVPMLETAARMVMEADIFVVVGTSLQVYPAAGLIEYVPPERKLFIIDKKIPAHRHVSGLTLIEKTATEGVQELINILKLDK